MVKSLMAEINNKRQRRVQRLKRLIVIMLIMVFVIPVTISVVLAVQLHGLGKQVSELQTEMYRHWRIRMCGVSLLGRPRQIPVFIRYI